MINLTDKEKISQSLKKVEIGLSTLDNKIFSIKDLNEAGKLIHMATVILNGIKNSFPEEITEDKYRYLLQMQDRIKEKYNLAFINSLIS